MRRQFSLAAAALSFVAVAWCASAFAVDPSLDISQYAHTSWRVRDGFAKGAINAVSQTPDGYLWLGTDFGLFRFDGVRAVPWEPPVNQPPLAESIRSLLVARDGTLWIGSRNGLASLKDGRFVRYPDFDGALVQTLLEDRDGTVWASGTGVPGAGKLCAVRDGAAHCVGGDGRFGSYISALYEDGNSNLWVGVADGLWRWKPGTPKFYSLPGEANGIEGLCEDGDGALLIGWKGGIYRLIDGKTEPYPLPRGVPQFRGRAMIRDRNGGLWIGTRNNGLLHVHQGRTDMFSTVDGLSGGDVIRVFEDQEGNIWVCTRGGLDRFRDYAVSTLTTKQGLSGDVVGSVLAYKNGSIWIGTLNGLNRWIQGRITAPATGSIRRDGTLGGSNPQSLFEDQSGRLWVSTAGGLWFLENGRFVLIKGIPGGNLQSIDEDAEHNIWVANNEQGLFALSPRNAVRNFPWQALGHKDNAIVIAADHRQGGLWLGFFQGGIAYFSNGQIRTAYTTSDGLGAGHVSDLLFDDSGALWISTQGGLSRLKNDRIATLTSKNGLPCDTVSWAMEEDDRSMWLYTDCGLIRIARAELDAWSVAADRHADASRRIQVTVFDSIDGMNSLVVGNYHPHVAKTLDGKLWFSSLDGLSVIDPHHLPFNSLPPPVHVEQVMADGKTYDAADGLHLPPHVRDLSIDYTALSLVVPERVHFKVKLEGQDSDWRELVNVRHVEYTNLPPRSYRFRVIACNNSGVWNETGASLDFSIAPAYYQTTWFKILCALASMALLWVLYQLRLRQIRQQYAVGLEASVGERMRIARELHDTLLQSFQGVMLQFQAARNMVSRKPDDAVHALDEAIAATAQAIVEGRDAIHDLRPDLVSQRDLAEMLNTTGRELGSAHTPNGSSPSFRLVVEGKQRELSPILQDEVYRITREVIRNAFQHADAGNIEAEIHYDAHQLRLRIRDDGKGIASEILAAGGRAGHWGITGIRERAQRVGADLKYWTEIGAGTEVELRIPAAIAYEKQRNGHTSRLFPKAGGDERRS